MLPNDWPPWVVMWALATAIFAACKLLTWSTTHVCASAWRQVGYFVAWPGLDARAFLDPRPLPQEERPKLGEWIFAVMKSLFGVVLLWGLVPLVPTNLPMVRGWVGMAGLIFVLHFGLFHVLSCAWRAAGVDAKPLMNWPLLATSLADFWSRRWNTAFRDLTSRFLFRPLAKSLGPKVGLAAGFLFSGLVHDLVISLPAGGGYGWPTLYFVLQGLGLLFERTRIGKRIAGRAFTAIAVVGPAAGLFHEPFVLNVILPFLHAIGT